ncbi:MAG: hypothetical protein E6K81_02270 [Candidatus Eisenbacteria bacterium]|uniref:Fibronectin type-III domain-containing protein n=1 Tax=Eiseniibacteriota bacterium TaxID=2212470 RepID=A0A538UDD7_UNCEI|nr:MAG: hypothetical protein E6K81_02270 [Candidatus Eisenbacteria bacterium]
MRARWFIPILALAALSGCRDDLSAPRDLSPPAAPRGFRSVTGDHAVDLSWLANTEADVAGYRVYEAPCASGHDCPYTRVGSTAGTAFTVTGLTNGQTRYFAVAALDAAGNESDLSYDTVFDTPRPEGTGAELLSFLTSPANAGWDFAGERVRAWDDPLTDMFYGDNGSVSQMFVPLTGDIQDAGYASSLDAVDFAPSAGWSPSGSVELIVGHCYVVRTPDGNYAKFRVNRFIIPTVGRPIVDFDWAYQVATGNPELKARPARPAVVGRRPITWIR